MAASTRRWSPFSLFFPVSFALIVAMVGIALKPGIDRVREWRSAVAAIATRGLVIEGDQLRAIIVNERASAAVTGTGEASYAVIGSTGIVTPEQANGARYFLPADAVRALRGKQVNVGFEVRSEPIGGAEEWLARLAVRGVLDTGWLPQHASGDWSITWAPVTIPSNTRGEPMEIIMWSDASGDGGRIQVRAIIIAPVSGM